MAGKICEMLRLCGQLAAAVVEVLQDTSCQNSRTVQELVSMLLHSCIASYNVAPSRAWLQRCKHLGTKAPV